MSFRRNALTVAVSLALGTGVAHADSVGAWGPWETNPLGPDQLRRLGTLLNLARAIDDYLVQDDAGEGPFASGLLGALSERPAPGNFFGFLAGEGFAFGEGGEGGEIVVGLEEEQQVPFTFAGEFRLTASPVFGPGAEGAEGGFSGTANFANLNPFGFQPLSLQGNFSANGTRFNGFFAGEGGSTLLFGFAEGDFQSFPFSSFFGGGGEGAQDGSDGVVSAFGGGPFGPFGFMVARPDIGAEGFGIAAAVRPPSIGDIVDLIAADATLEYNGGSFLWGHDVHITVDFGAVSWQGDWTDGFLPDFHAAGFLLNTGFQSTSVTGEYVLGGEVVGQFGGGALDLVGKSVVQYEAEYGQSFSVADVFYATSREFGGQICCNGNEVD